jgi:hypothetical protein
VLQRSGHPEAEVEVAVAASRRLPFRKTVFTPRGAKSDEEL